MVLEKVLYQIFYLVKNGYEISGILKYEGKNLQDISIEERAQKGIFLAFQYPLEIPGVNTNNFLKTFKYNKES